MRLVVDAEVRERIAKEVEWYRPRKPGLDDDFLGEVGKALERILQFPLACPIVHRRLRQYKLDRFPFHLIYYVGKEEILVVRIFHSVGDPKQKFRGLRRR